ncbi:hypothetical protein BJF82_06795 [Kytococcus sp. CUA-901]|nr:hypothetical protein BJF82_06795 [Kytococcus sp. CUA-901]
MAVRPNWLRRSEVSAVSSPEVAGSSKCAVPCGASARAPSRSSWAAVILAWWLEPSQPSSALHTGTAANPATAASNHRWVVAAWAPPVSAPMRWAVASTDARLAAALPSTSSQPSTTWVGEARQASRQKSASRRSSSVMRGTYAAVYLDHNALS